MERPGLFSSVPIQCLGAVLLVAGTTGMVLLLGGRGPDRLLLALVFILPVGWSALRWGRWPCACAALAALLAGQFLFVPLRDTLALSGLVAWLLLAALLVGGNVLTDRLQATLARSQDSVYEEYQSAFVQGLRSALAGLRSAEEVSTTLASYLQQLLQAGLVEVRTRSPVALTVRSPEAGRAGRAPDRVVPFPGAPDLAGEIRLWGDDYLPPEDSYLLRRLAAQGALVLAQVAREERGPCQDAPASAGCRTSVTAGCNPAL